MTTLMLIDARHPEETRVAVVNNNTIEHFDFDSAEHKQIKGDIYLAKVIRVEPSLQAAFVDFGGNRHGFLSFGEIHPDYYQIPREDREALLAEEAAHAAEEALLRASDDDDNDEDGDDGFARDSFDESYDEGGFGGGDFGESGGLTEVDTSEKNDIATIEAGELDNAYPYNAYGEDDDSNAPRGHGSDLNDGDDARQGGGRGRHGQRRQGGRDDKGGNRARQADELRARRMALRRRYKIQDVIHRRQVLLVQVVKEERGNKGAALTTYLSLAGRYCVLMPNSSHGGGISRKINSAADRKRLKSIIGELNLPKSMGCIVRTAGLQRTKAEIRRDFDYLARLWDDIRETTLGSSAPALIYSDSDLIKRAIRDIYHRDIDAVLVEGEASYHDAHDFMKLLMPSHARRVKHYADAVPLFQRYGAEDQLAALYDPVVQLKSGGYIVINPTEALVSIDINSGRSTREHGIEATAVNTNLEATREIARQLRLRDMAGLIVIDFIDMEYGSNVRKVEKAMRDALRNDRARIQVGRISSFGLMEMSRQRLRTGMLEATTRACPHCDGSGLVRTAASAGLSALRLIEDEAARGRGTLITLFASQEATIYVLNAKRGDLADIEARYGVRVEVIPEGETEGAKMRVVSSGPRNDHVARLATAPLVIPVDDDLDEDDADWDDDTAEDGAQDASDEGEGGKDGRRKRRKRRRGRGRDGEEIGAATMPAARDDGFEASDDGDTDDDDGDDDDGDAGDAGEGAERGDTAGGLTDDDTPRKRRRRGRRRRGGRKNRDDNGEIEGSEGQQASDEGGIATESADDDAEDQVDAGIAAPVATVSEDSPPAIAKPRRGRRKQGLPMRDDLAATVVVGAVVAEAVGTEAVREEAPEEGRAADVSAPAKPRHGRKAAPAALTEEASGVDAVKAAPPKPRRSRRKVADVAEAPEAETAPASPEGNTAEVIGTGAAESSESGEQGDNEASARRGGWWQRTFGT